MVQHLVVKNTDVTLDFGMADNVRKSQRNKKAFTKPEGSKVIELYERSPR